MIVGFLIVYALAYTYDAALRDVAFFDGWVLFAGMGLQFLFHIKKKMPRWLSGSTQTWAKIHIHCGYFVVACFALHTRLSWPETVLEGTLWMLFVLVVASGIIGTFLTNAIPLRLEQLSERLEFHELPKMRSALADKAHNLALSSVQDAGTTKISDLYIAKLHQFFAKPHNTYAHLMGSKRPLKQMLFELEGLDTELESKTRKAIREMRLLVELKTKFDFQYAHEIALRIWLCIHIPATYALIVLSILHVAVIYAFRSGVA